MNSFFDREYSWDRGYMIDNYNSDYFDSRDPSFDEEEYENDRMYDQIYDFEYDNNLGYVNKKYYIGSYLENKEGDKLELLVNFIKITTFYKFTNVILSKYMNICRHLKPTIDIMQIIIDEDGVYKYVIIKTFWIKIIQRKWKQIIQQKKQYVKKIIKQIYSFSNTYQITTRNNKYNGLSDMLF